ncbi:hypothetical protein [Methylobacterium sp. WL64]|nr:hypothetical protein [Methylobacterium sp. WL64]
MTMLWLTRLCRDALEPEAAAVVARILQDTETAKVIDFGRPFCRIV